jgi:hypothetical protein
MSKHGNELALITTWVEMRADKLSREWIDEFHLMSGRPFFFPFRFWIHDAATRQAQAECLAYMCGDPIPASGVALQELLAWIRNEICSQENSKASESNKNCS